MYSDALDVELDTKENIRFYSIEFKKNRNN